MPFDEKRIARLRANGYSQKLIDEMQEHSEEFKVLVAEYLKHHTNRELADFCECIPSTVYRWASGEAVPMGGMQRVVIQHIKKIR